MAAPVSFTIATSTACKRQDWLDALIAAGLENVRGVIADHSELEPGTYEVFVGIRP